MPIEGAVIQRDADTKKQVPIADVVITASDGIASATTRSEAVGIFQARAAEKSVVRDTHHDHFPASVLRTTGFECSNRKIGDAGRTLCRVNDSDPSADRGQAQPSRGGGHEYPGEIYPQFPDRNECGQRSQDLSGGKHRQHALQSSGSLFTRWEVEGYFCYRSRSMPEQTIRSATSEPPALRGRARLPGSTQADLFMADATSPSPPWTGQTQLPS